jgi:hypothetical protein
MMKKRRRRSIPVGLLITATSFDHCSKKRVTTHWQTNDLRHLQLPRSQTRKGELS